VHQRSLHPAITTPAIEAVLEAGRRAGALGGKALGASGGGCVLLIAPEGSAELVRGAAEAVSSPLEFGVDHEGLSVERLEERAA
jgi:D-glycero-alpha-D-manno-heptose-7-phosphate kinase